ncbi:MAG: hypothetical protein A4E56_00378 [Pelotomaculum sp. PtaU1.Bin065]|nr:MAG: hypothetical protein A4E56_00378 [Pelotomaculum sp. PtaU1.Bin065]
MVRIAKTELTIKLERDIWEATNKQGVFCCFEVTIGWFGEERVDYLTYDTKGIWRCYEIKASKSDFYSQNHNTFIGHFNYYVMPKELYEQVKDEVPAHIGIYINGFCHKKAKRQELGIDEQILKNSMIRSLSREVEKVIKSNNPTIIEGLKRRLNRHKKDAENYKRKYWELMRIGQEKYGIRWYKE